MKYRADVDGLRAVAVLSVIAFHINPRYLPGGFLGVDIFFVISGFLITGLLLAEAAETGKISILNFYRRRVQRIAPAFLSVLSFVLVAGFIIMLPEDFNKLLSSSVWSVVSLANFYFNYIQDSGYFSPSSLEAPLLHIWSLGVEEQYYIFWPFIIIASLGILKAADKGRLLFFLFALIILISIIGSERALKHSSTFSYYMLPTRAWELLVGGVAALFVHRGEQLRQGFLQAMAYAGLVMLLGGLYFVNEKMHVPGVGAVPAVLGTAMLIYSGQYQKNAITEFLSSRPLVKIGLISFSAYLWHWPILAFLRYLMVDITPYVGLAVLVATLALSFASYYGVEQPFRKMRIAPAEAIAYIYALPSLLIVALAIVLSGMISIKSDAMYDWKELANMNSDVKPAYEYYYNCQEQNFRKSILAEARCSYPDGAPTSTILVGDSHGAHFVGMMRSLASAYEFSFRNATQTACSFIFDGDVSNIMQEYREGCSTYRRVMEAEVAKYKNVIIGGNWSKYLSTDEKMFKQEFERTVARLVSMGKNVIIMAEAPSFPSFNLKCRERNSRVNVADCSNRFDVSANVYERTNYFDSLAAKYPNVQVFSPFDYLCPNGICSPYINGQPIYFDNWHLSMVGSGVLGDLVVQKDASKLNPFAHLH